MSCESLTKFEDFIGLYDRLFHFKSNESVEEIINSISSTLISKSKMPFDMLFKSIFQAMEFNNLSIYKYVEILNQVSTKYSLKKCDFVNSYSSSYFDTEESNKFKLDQELVSSFPKEGEISYMIMHYQIDGIKEYLSNNSLKGSYIEIPFGNLSPLEACCYFGSVNIFFFFISTSKYKIDRRCLRYSVIGGNTDIINECMKNNQIDEDCFNDILSSHNNKLLEYILENGLFNLDIEPDSNYNECSVTGHSDDEVKRNFDFYKIIESQNLKAAFLLYKKDDISIFPWCAAFPQLLDIIKNEYMNHPSMVLNASDGYRRRILHYAADYACLETLKFLISQCVYIDIADAGNTTALHYALKKDRKEIVEYLISQYADTSAKDEYGRTALHIAAEKKQKRNSRTSYFTPSRYKC